MTQPFTPSIPQSSLETHRQQYPSLLNKLYFNYGGQGPMAQKALQAMYEAQDRVQREGPFSGEINRWIQAECALTRQTLAQDLGVPEESMTLTENVTVGCNIPLWGIEWRAGDHILLTDCEHPGVVAAVGEICRRFGVQSSTCPILDTVNGGDPVEVIARHLRPQTRLLVISHILWNTGQVLPLKAIAQLCHGQPSQPVKVLVDAAQSVGVLPLNLTDLEIDYYAFTGHKWYGGPAGLGGLYVRPEILADTRPTVIGWRSITMDGAGNPTGWKPNGQRFEVATSDYALQAGLRTAIAIQQEWGTPEARYQRICHLSQLLWQQLQPLPAIRCVRQTPPDSGLVSFWVLTGTSPSPQRHQYLVQTLEKQGVYLRTLLFPHCVRACVHYFTLESEIEQLVTTIARVLEL